MKDILFEICSADSVSGRENAAVQKAKAMLEPIAQTQIDANGNLIAQFGDLQSDYHILLDAHMDQIGLIVTYIDDNGFIKADACGGIDRRVLPGSVVNILCSEPVPAIVCCLPPHLSDGDEDTAIKADSIWLDTGMCKTEAERKIALGDRVIIAGAPKQLLGNRVTAVGLDNGAGVAVLLHCAQTLSKMNLPCKVTVLLSSQEEVGGMGAKTGVYALNPDEAIVLDVGFAMQTGVEPMNGKPMSGGPMIGIAPILNQKMTNRLIKVAEENNIPYQLEAMGGITGTNADGITTIGGGVQAGLISIPLRNMHTQAEVIDLDDMEKTAALLCEYIRKRSAQVK